MATLSTLSGANGPLTDLTVPLERHDVQQRWIYAFPEVIEWLQNELPGWNTGRLNAIDTPQEQVDNVIYKWIVGRRFIYNRMFKDLMPGSDEVWEMKTADVRIFGWLCKPKKFIAVLPGYSDHFHDRPQLYEDARQLVIRRRDALNLDEPKIARGTFDALVSV